jgi:alpha-tubulin suppressor-like RCC1 family protein
MQVVEPVSAEDAALVGNATSGTVPDSVARTNQVLIRWGTSTASSAAPSARTVASLARAAGGAVSFRRVDASGADVYRLTSSLGSNAQTTLAALRSVSGVASVEPDLWMTADVLPDDPLATSLWGLQGPADGSNWGIDVQDAWPTTTGTGVVVAVIDTGLVSHPDLAGQSVPGYDMISDPSISNDGDGRDPDPSDPGDWCGAGSSSWHGTHVAGTIAAIANNQIGVFGAAPGVKVQPVRVLGTCGGYESDVADGIRWAAGGSVPGVPANPTPARVLNLSLGGASSTCPSDYASAIADARSRGATVVAAAGNSSADVSTETPANCSGVVAVAATDQYGKKASFSNYGAGVAIAGPGVAIESTVDSGTTVPVGPSYASYSGTSMATPHVAASAALLLAAYPTLSPDQVATILEGTATPFAADGSSGCPALGCGAGVVDIGRAMQRLAEPAPLLIDIAASSPHPVPNAQLTLTATAVDAASVAAADYNVDGGKWTAMSATGGSFGAQVVSVGATLAAPSSEGTHSLCVRATDEDSNTSDGTNCVAIVVDAGPPTVSGPSLSPNPVAQNATVTVKASATDGNAVASLQVRVDGEAWSRMLPDDGDFGGKSEAASATLGAVPRFVATGYSQACAVLTDGTLECWGDNEDGQLGDGTYVNSSRPVPGPTLPGVQAIAGGLYFTCALLTGGSVSCWGDNAGGQMGDGTTTTRPTAAPVAGISGAVAIGAGEFYACALLSGGTVSCWGDNTYGQLGNGGTSQSLGPVAVQDLSDVKSIASAALTTCALLNDGTVSCWGFGGEGQLGNGSFSNTTAPVQVTGLTGVTGLWGGADHFCAAVAGPAAYCWGYNRTGQLGDGTRTNRSTPVQVKGLPAFTALALGDQYSCALLADTSLRCWGYDTNGELGIGSIVFESWTPAPVFGLTHVVEVQGGGHSPCALLADGTVRCWGYNYHGEIGDGTTVANPFPSTVLGLGPLAAGAHSVCIEATDSVGNDSSAACATLTVTDSTAPWVLDLSPTTSSPTDAATVSYRLTFDEPVTGLASSDFSISGTSAGWSVSSIAGSGSGPYTVTLTGPSAGDGTVLLSLKALSVSDTSDNAGPAADTSAASVAIDRSVPIVSSPTLAPARADGKTAVVVAATANDPSGILSGRLTVDGGPWISMLPLDGDLGGSQESLFGSVDSPVVSVVTGAVHSCALLADSTVRCWGDNEYGQLGDGTTINRSTPVPVLGLTGVTALAAGLYHTCALMVDTTVRCWGFNWLGELGSGTIDDSLVPVQVVGLSGVVAITARWEHTCALLGDGTARCWGYNQYGQLGDGTDGATGSYRVSPVVVSLTGIKKLVAGGFHTCALRDDGTVWCWGWDIYGELGLGTGVSEASTPQQVPGLSGVTDIDLGNFHTCALMADTSVRCWGSNPAGQVGDGTQVTRYSPVAVSGLSGVSALAAAGSSTCARMVDGTASCWGWNPFGQMGNGTSGVDAFTPVAVANLNTIATLVGGANHMCALLADSTLRCWGSNSNGQLGDGTAADRSSAVSVVGLGVPSLAEGSHSICVIATDAAGNSNPSNACSSLAVTDAVPPAVSAFVPTTLSPTGQRTISYSLTFDQPVFGLATVDFSIGGSSSSWSVESIQGAGAGPYTVTLDASDPTDGIVTVTLKAQSVEDFSGNLGPLSAVTAASVTVSPAVGSTYHAISPARVLDSRPSAKSRANIGLWGKFTAGTVRTFRVSGVTYVGAKNGAIAVPANAIAVTGNLTMTGASAAGLIALGPTMSTTGDTTTLNFSMTSATASENRANNVTMGLASDGTLSAVFRSSTAGATVDLIFDVTGYFLPDSSGATYHALAPGRVLDTRAGPGQIGRPGKFATGAVRTISVAGVKGLGWSSALVPSNATAVTANVTVTNATSNGYASLGPTMSSLPSTSTLNVVKGHNTANGVTVALKSGRLQAVWVGTKGSSADVVLDITGYFTADSTGLKFYPVNPYRVLDSSTNSGLTGPFATGTAQTLAIGGTGGGGVPTDARGIAGNLTIVGPSTAGYAFIAPTIGGTPSSSTVNANANTNTANGFDVSLDGSGNDALIWMGGAGSTANLQLDIYGYWK